jgi:hypothetical protein
MIKTLLLRPGLTSALGLTHKAAPDHKANHLRLGGLHLLENSMRYQLLERHTAGMSFKAPAASLSDDSLTYGYFLRRDAGISRTMGVSGDSLYQQFCAFACESIRVCQRLHHVGYLVDIAVVVGRYTANRPFHASPPPHAAPTIPPAVLPVRAFPAPVGRSGT